MTDRETDTTTRGQSFRDRELRGADFASRDVRGADFTGADLRSASFRDAKLGVTPRVATIVLGVSMLISIVAGLVIGWLVFEIRGQARADEWDQAAAGSSLIFLLLVFVALLIWRGFDTAIRVIAGLYVVVLLGNVIANLIWEEVEWFRALRFTVLLVALCLAILAGILGRVTGGVFGTWSVVLVAVLGGLASGEAQGGLAGVVVAVSLAFISKRAVRGDERDRSVRVLAHSIVGRWGTRFDRADLSEADFTGTDASRCGVKGATLDGVIWDPNQQLPLDLPEDARPPDR